MPRIHLPPFKLESVGGAVPLDSPFYVMRRTDAAFHSALAHGESVLVVKGPRQMGKTSLLARGLQQARGAGAKVILTDIQKLNSRDLSSIDRFLFTLSDLVSDQLDLPVLPEESWDKHLSPATNFARYFADEVLPKLPTPLVWGIDELDRLFVADFGNEVFSLFRSWQTERSRNPNGIWGRLTLIISYATEASLFIQDLDHSPFDLGTHLTLEDFNLDEVAELNSLYGGPLETSDELSNFYSLVGGQPFLVRRGLHEMVAKELSFEALVKEADRQDGIFGDHLRRIPLLLAEDPGFREIVRGVLRGHMCPTLESFTRLQSAGVVTGESKEDVRPRCDLYAKFLARHLG